MFQWPEQRPREGGRFTRAAEAPQTPAGRLKRQRRDTEATHGIGLGSGIRAQVVRRGIVLRQRGVVLACGLHESVYAQAVYRIISCIIWGRTRYETRRSEKRIEGKRREEKRTVEKKREEDNMT